jgi:ATP-dependent exoDNAse (exonuclease V) alpha subunit
MDGGRQLHLDPQMHPHLDHGYAVTSHSSQGRTADRVLINVDTELAAKDLLNNRMAYFAVSRAAYDVGHRKRLLSAASRVRARTRLARNEPASTEYHFPEKVRLLMRCTATAVIFQTSGSSRSS